jgi:hypothetical protein
VPRRVLLSAAVLCAATAFAPSPAHAVAACVENESLTFAPPLTVANQLGKVTIAYELTCANVPGALRGAHENGTVTYDYFGSCLAAVFSEGTESVLVGGTLYLMAWTGGVAQVHVLVPNPASSPSSACPVTTATGTGPTVIVP